MLTTVLQAIFLCFIPLITMLAIFTVTVREYLLTRGLFACFLGIVAVVPIAALQFVLSKTGLFSTKNLLSVLVSSVIFCGVIEEAVKTGFLFLVPLHWTDKKIFFMYAVTAGFALGCFETFIYLVSGHDQLGLRLFTAVLLHTFCAGLDGFVVYSIKDKRTCLWPIVFPVILHGVYDFFAGFREIPVFFYLSLAAVLFAAIECRIRYKE